MSDKIIFYEGCLASADGFVDVLEGGDNGVNPKSMWSNYIQQRKPCVIRNSNFVKDLAGKWDNSYLSKVAGNEKVQVEVRKNSGDKFGEGNMREMQFSEFLGQLGDDKKEGLLYLTTQTLGTGPEGRPDLASPPVLQLLQNGDVPLRHELLGNLVPMNINVWMGAGQNSSSGLHHDYHDNLYLLLRGRKRFRLYSPADAENMYTVGTLAKVHPNGRINYEGFLTREDGTEEAAHAAMLAQDAQEKAERELEEAEKDLENNVPGAQERVRKAEEALDAAMELALEAEAGDEFYDDFNDSDEDINEDEEETENRVKRQKIGHNDDCVDPCKVPINFSQVKNPESANSAMFPNFYNATPCFAEVKAGDMLFLPAGWFHEVTSFRDDGGSHFALNYWMHPPNAPSGGATFEKPYTSAFWPKDLAERDEKTGKACS